MSHETINAHGLLVYRTKLLRDEGIAIRFANCLQANRRFDTVEVVVSKQAKDGGWYVEFRPVNEDKAHGLFERQHEQRSEKARTEGLQYQFLRDTGSGRFWWCWSTSGEVYEVTDGPQSDCTCPDHQYRCKKAGLECKHIQALRLQRAAGMAR